MKVRIVQLFHGQPSDEHLGSDADHVESLILDPAPTEKVHVDAQRSEILRAEESLHVLLLRLFHDVPLVLMGVLSTAHVSLSSDFCHALAIDEPLSHRAFRGMRHQRFHRISHPIHHRASFHIPRAIFRETFCIPGRCMLFGLES